MTVPEASTDCPEASVTVPDASSRTSALSPRHGNLCDVSLMTSPPPQCLCSFVGSRGGLGPRENRSAAPVHPSSKANMAPSAVPSRAERARLHRPAVANGVYLRRAHVPWCRYAMPIGIFTC